MKYVDPLEQMPARRGGGCFEIGSIPSGRQIACNHLDICLAASTISKRAR
jgi:hypothetical protein